MEPGATPAFWRRHAIFVVVPVCYYFCAKFGVLFTIMPEGTAILWPPNSVLLAALILGHGRGMVPLVLLTICAEVLADMTAFSLGEALLFGATNAGEAVLAYVLLKRSKFDPRFATLADVPRFVLAGPVAAALLASALGAAIYDHFRGGEVGYLQFARIWWFGDAMGLLFFTPLILSFALGVPGIRPAIRQARRSDWALVGLTMAALGLFAASRNGVLWGLSVTPLLLLPFAIVVASRLEMRTASTVTALIALTVVVATARGHDPFGAVPAREAVLRSQEFLLVLGTVALGLAALLSQLRAQGARLQAANEGLDHMNRHLEARVLERTASLHALNADLERLAMDDPLTGFVNRRAFFARARQEFERSRRHHIHLAVLMVDIDHFKAVNDRYGHQMGDRVLQQVARAIGASLRPEDTIGRYGGDEFAVLAPGADLGNAATLATRVQNELAQQSFPSDDNQLRVGVSIGVASLDDGDDTLESLLKRADDALYAAKRAGRNCVMSSA